MTLKRHFKINRFIKHECTDVHLDFKKRFSLTLDFLIYIVQNSQKIKYFYGFLTKMQ